MADKSEAPAPTQDVYKMSYEKYLQLYDPQIHPYTRAYLIPQFRGILQSKEAWDTALKDFVGK